MGKKLLFLGNFAWSLSVYRKLEMVLQYEYENIEIWIAKSPKFRESPFLNHNHKINNANIKVISKEELKKSHNYQGAHLLITCGFPYKIPTKILKQEKVLGINLHPSLLPNYWGPDPIRNQILKKDNNFGVSLQFIGENFDAGLVIEQDRLEYTNQACIYEILFGLSYVAAKLVEKFVSNKNLSTYKRFIKSSDTLLSKNQYAASVDIERYKNDLNITSRLLGTEKWLRKLLQNES